MIIDLKKFIGEKRPDWVRLEQFLALLDKNPDRRLALEEIQDFHGLYQRASADLARIATFSSEDGVRTYLESLVARGYAQIYENRKQGARFSPMGWFFGAFPRTFRKHAAAFYIALLVTLVGSAFGGLALTLDPEAKDVLLPFAHLQGSPTERVEKEESALKDRLEGQKAIFSSYLMTHNIQVSLHAVAWGMTWGIGTLILLFYNGIILGAVAVDYILAGETAFLAGWLLPHGSVEIPSILIAGQAGLVLAQAVLGRNSPKNLKQRLKDCSGDVITLAGGLALLLTWAGIIESFFSQYHEPVFPYWLKISFGAVQLCLLAAFLGWSGKKQDRTIDKEEPA